MFLAAATRLSELSPALKDRKLSLFPDPEKIPEIAKELAVAVAQLAGLLKEEAELKIKHAFWEPHYPLFINK